MNKFNVTRRMHTIPRPFYIFAEHVKEPRACWHENPCLRLAYDLRHLDMGEVWEENGYSVNKTLGGHRILWAVYDADGHLVRKAKSEREAAGIVYQQEA